MLSLFVKLLLFKLNKASSKCCICFSSIIISIIESANLECKFPLHETNGHSLMNILSCQKVYHKSCIDSVCLTLLMIRFVLYHCSIHLFQLTARADPGRGTRVTSPPLSQMEYNRNNNAYPRKG